MRERGRQLAAGRVLCLYEVGKGWRVGSSGECGGTYEEVMQEARLHGVMVQLGLKCEGSCGVGQCFDWDELDYSDEYGNESDDSDDYGSYHSESECFCDACMAQCD